MNIFIDTEFTGLTSDPRLLSIGLVADNKLELYIELTDGWSEAICSSWVKEHVLPLLGNGERLTRRKAGERIMAWLSSFKESPTLLGDTDWDTTLIADLMHECGISRDSYRLELLAFSGKAQAKSFELAKLHYFKDQLATPHHAITDARAFHAAWHCVFAKLPGQAE
jgi:hypothetical protein